jgi:hypothetical protein
VTCCARRISSRITKNIRETFNFLGNWTSEPFADFLLGLLDRASRQTQPPQNYLFSTNFGLFARDDL